MSFHRIYFGKKSGNNGSDSVDVWNHDLSDERFEKINDSIKNELKCEYIQWKFRKYYHTPQGIIMQINKESKKKKIYKEIIMDQQMSNSWNDITIYREYCNFHNVDYDTHKDIFQKRYVTKYGFDVVFEYCETNNKQPKNPIVYIETRYKGSADNFYNSNFSKSLKID